MDRRRCSKLTIPPSSDSRPLVFHSDRQALPIARLSRQGLLATADNCQFGYNVSYNWTHWAASHVTGTNSLRRSCCKPNIASCFAHFKISWAIRDDSRLVRPSLNQPVFMTLITTLIITHGLRPVCSDYDDDLQQLWERKNKENGESEGKTILWASSGQTGAWTEILLEMK